MPDPQALEITAVPRRKPRAAAQKPRRTQAMRSDEMRGRILDAAFAVLKERGFAGLTTPEVALRAGVSRGALVHHFPSKLELVTAAMEHVFGIALADGLRLAESARHSGNPAQALLKDTQAFYFSDCFAVGLDMLLAGGKDPALKDTAVAVVHNYRRPVERQWLAVIEELGLSAELSEDLLLLTVSLVRGLGVRHLWAPDPAQVQRLLRLWVDILGSHLASRQPSPARAASPACASQAHPEPSAEPPPEEPRPVHRCAAV
jgi:AcrR family transcriptional regulator